MWHEVYINKVVMLSESDTILTRSSLSQDSHNCTQQARNIMLQTSTVNSCKAIAKVGDFGLAIKLGQNVHQVLNIHQGSKTHMAPEVFLKGQLSRASDV